MDLDDSFITVSPRSQKARNNFGLFYNTSWKKVKAMMKGSHVIIHRLFNFILATSMNFMQRSLEEKLRDTFLIKTK
jgi:ribosome biogenesis protein Tsr3